MGTAPRMADGNFVVYVDVNTGKRQSRFGQQLSSRMGYIAASLAVCMLLAVALSGSDEGSGLAVKSARITAAKATILSEGRKEKIYARKEMMNQVINQGLAGLPVKDVAIAKGLIAKAGKLPTLAAMKTTKLQDADCANKDVYEMILDKFTGLAANLTTEKDMRVQQNLTTFTEKAAAYTAWIDSESAYREALNKKETRVRCGICAGPVRQVRYRGDGRRGVLRRDYRAHGRGEGGPDQAAGDDRRNRQAHQRNGAADCDQGDQGQQPGADQCQGRGALGGQENAGIDAEAGAQDQEDDDGAAGGVSRDDRERHEHPQRDVKGDHGTR